MDDRVFADFTTEVGYVVCVGSGSGFLLGVAVASVSIVCLFGGEGSAARI